MSSMDQAFVKAFARRNRSGRNESGNSGVGPDPAVSPLDPLGWLKVDSSVAGTAEIWIDPIEDQIARADIAECDVPKPHLEPHVESVFPQYPDADDSLQHIHTAYASGIADQLVAAADSASALQATRSQAPAAPQAPATPQRPPIATPDPVEVAEIRVDSSAAPSPVPQPSIPFKAVWEVDVFDVPARVADLFFEGKLFQKIAQRMSDAVNTGLKSILVTSVQAGEGRSSAAIGIAMAAAAAGIRVALVDADTEDPTLADDLRLDLQYGWVDTIRGGIPIKEVAVHAIEDGVTLIPLMPPHGRTSATAAEIVQLISLLNHRFDLIVIDGPEGSSSHIGQCASSVDSAIIVRDVTRTNTVAINEFSYRLRESGVNGVGVVENFA